MKDNRAMGRGFTTVLPMQCNASGFNAKGKVARHANANAKAPDCGSKSGDAGRSLRAAEGVQSCFVRPGEERRTALGLFALFFGAQGLRYGAADKGNTG